MEIGSKIYDIVVLDEARSDSQYLSQFQKLLEREGFDFTVPLADLCSGKNDVSVISHGDIDPHVRIEHTGMSSHVRRHEGKIQLVVDPAGKGLKRFAEDYFN